MKVFFSKRATKNYLSIKSYLSTRFGEKTTQIFEEKTKHFLDLLEFFPEMGAIEVPEKQIRGFQLTKRTRFFYRIKNKRIIILSFFDVRQNPNKKPG